MAIIGSNPRFWLVALLASWLAGCSSQPREPIAATPKNAVESALYEAYGQWRGVPYRSGGLNKKGIDCSGLVYLTFRDAFNLHLPRNTWDQSQLGRPVKPAERQSGDLVFFKISLWGNHVGIYLGNGKFMHASASQGVIISRLDNPYWQKHYWKTVRPSQDYLVFR